MNKYNIEEVVITPCADGFSTQLLAEHTIGIASERRNNSGRSILVALMLMVLVWTIPFPSRAATLDAEGIVSASNNARTSSGLATLTTNAALTQAANAKASSMFAEQYFNHVSPHGVQPWSFMTAAGYAFTAAGENLAMDFVDNTDVVQAWMHSPEHRKNLLGEKYTDIGVAVQTGVLNGVETTIVVQFFGATAAQTIAPQPQTVAVTPTPIAAKTTPIAKTTSPVAHVTEKTPEPTPNVDTKTPEPVKQAISDQTTSTTSRLPQVEGFSTKAAATTTLQTPVMGDYNPDITLLTSFVMCFYIVFFVALIALQKTPSPTTMLFQAQTTT